jgi:BirA family biotin operon repressor/biotin-[acetyl-CoA-carboxylase] ligase
MRGSPYTDLERPPLHLANLRRALVVPGGLWTRVDLHVETASTNFDAALAAREGAAEGLVVLAERQSAGRGRLGRRWESPARSGLAVSVVLRPADPRPDLGWPATPPNRYGWLSLLAGVALAGSVSRIGELEAALKWPNDLLVAERKCAGILAETVPTAGGGRPGAVVVGIGLNVTLRADELPYPEATSLRLAGATCTDRDPLLRALLRGFAEWYARWRGAGGDPEASGLREAYLDRCATLGQRVRVSLPDGTSITGLATDVDADGRLVVCDGDRVSAVAAGDVVHVRPGPPVGAA